MYVHTYVCTYVQCSNPKGSILNSIGKWLVQLQAGLKHVILPFFGFMGINFMNDGRGMRSRDTVCELISHI